MKAIRIHQYGGPDVLVHEEVSKPAAGSGQVLVQVAAASINPVDAIERDGGTKAWNPFTFPRTLGWDVSGTVVEVADGVTDFDVGDPVFGWSSQTYAEFCLADPSTLAIVPHGLALEDAAALPLVVITGSQLISATGAGVAGQTVLVSGALGGVGRAAVHAALDMGATVIAGVRQKQVDAALALGADRVVALDDAATMAALEPVDVVANTLRGDSAAALMPLLKDGGRFLSVTGAPPNAGDFPTIEVVAFVSKNDARTLQYAADAIVAGKLVIPIAMRLPLREARTGHEALKRGVGGKIVLIP